MNNNIRRLDPEKDLDAAKRIWHECGWYDDSDAELRQLVKLPNAWVATAGADNAPECMVLTGPGNMHYQGESLNLSHVAAVSTSRVARGQGLARTLTAHAMAQDAAAGTHVFALGMFEQGFYDKLGFGTGAAHRFYWIDPADIRLPKSTRARMPLRLTKDDAAKMHAARRARLRWHCSCALDCEESTSAMILENPKGFGLGYADGPDGELTHFIWVVPEDVEHGPYRVWCIVHQSGEQLMELLALIASWRDQVYLVKMPEPPGIQLQDIVHRRLAQLRTDTDGQFAKRQIMLAWWQMRIANMSVCMNATHFDGPDVRFNLEVTDPITAYLTDDAPWQGCAGSYTITLGKDSSAIKGMTDGLPLMRASIGAFTRMWLGVGPASGLAMTDDINAPAELLTALDRTIRLPEPINDWDL